MCGIAISVNCDILPILQVQEKRGPDLSKVLKFGNVSFGHNLLSIIGHCEQPIQNERYMMTFNGCWYDYRDYYTFDSDTKSLFYHFNKLGTEAIEDVNGMFAIGLLDKQERNIYCWVDRFGQKPLYYFHEGDKFAVASSPAGLFHLKDKWDLDYDAINSYWLLGGTMGENHLFRGIKKLCASEMLTYNLGSKKVSIKRYYTPKFVDKPDIEGLVIDAIDKVKVSDVPVHIFLSGGIDSTLVASRFNGGLAVHLDSPERQYAQEVANKYDISLKVLSPKTFHVEHCLTDFARQSGEPCMAALIPYITASEVSKHGRVAITANGADELFFGYDRTTQDTTLIQRDHIFRGGLFKDDYAHVGFNTHFLDGRLSSGRIRELDYYVQFDLNKTLDFASMCHSLEVRSPFLDHRLVEAALSIPEEVHRKMGNKTLLKNILKKEGFSDQFLNRPKIGFSLHYKPEGLDQWIKKAWYWVQTNGFLRIDEKKLNGRDLRYLEMSALSFYFWFDTWKDKINK